MDKIIEKLFDVYMETEDFPLGRQEKKKMDREWELFDLLYDKLEGETKEALREYTNLCAEKEKEQLKILYMQGFKTGVKMIVESMKD